MYGDDKILLSITHVIQQRKKAISAVNKLI